MKNTLLFCLLFFGLKALGFTTYYEKIVAIKNAKTIVALTGDSAVDAQFKQVIEKHWTFNEITEYLPKEEAYFKAIRSNRLYVLALDTVKSVGTLGDTRGIVTKTLRAKGLFIGLSVGKKDYHFFLRHIAYPSNSVWMETSMVFAISSLNQTFNTYYDRQFVKNKQYKNLCIEMTAELKNKTVYILENWVGAEYNYEFNCPAIKGMDLETIKTIYPGPIKIVNRLEWNAAIIGEKPGVIYSIIVPVPTIGVLDYKHFLIDASTKQLYGTFSHKHAGENLRYFPKTSKWSYYSETVLEKYAKVLAGNFKGYKWY